MGLNKYRAEFFARCPINGIRVKYALLIETTEAIRVELIVNRVEAIREGLHEALADELHAAFGGKQTLTADHHSVIIETTRGGISRNDQYLDQSVGGMAGTPGY